MTLHHSHIAFIFLLALKQMTTEKNEIKKACPQPGAEGPQAGGSHSPMTAPSFPFSPFLPQLKPLFLQFTYEYLWSNLSSVLIKSRQRRSTAWPLLRKSFL